MQSLWHNNEKIASSANGTYGHAGVTGITTLPLVNSDASRAAGCRTSTTNDHPWAPRRTTTSSIRPTRRPLLGRLDRRFLSYVVLMLAQVVLLQITLPFLYRINRRRNSACCCWRMYNNSGSSNVHRPSSCRPIDDTSSARAGQSAGPAREPRSRPRAKVPKTSVTISFQNDGFLLLLLFIQHDHSAGCSSSPKKSSNMSSRSPINSSSSFSSSSSSVKAAISSSHHHPPQSFVHSILAGPGARPEQYRLQKIQYQSRGWRITRRGNDYCSSSSVCDTRSNQQERRSWPTTRRKKKM
jgi:hypothetical protein